MIKSVLAATLAAALLAAVAGCDSMMMKNQAMAPAAPPAPPALPMNGLVTAPSGMTLYTFDKDTANSGTSACNGPCAQLWPPFPAAADATPTANFTIVTREDGSHQWAYKGWPLYTYSKDVRAGDTSGDKFKDVWHVVKN